MKIPSSFFRLLGGLLVLFLFSSCGSQYHLASYYNNDDPIYAFVEETGDTIKIDVLDSEWDVHRMFKNNWKFRWNYSLYAQNQPYSWHSDFYFNNRMWRSRVSQWDFYWNRHDYWWNWASNYPFYSWSHWNRWGFGFGDPYYYGYRYNPYRWYYPTYWNMDRHWFRYNHGYAYNFNRENQNISYNIGRRGSNGIVITPNGNRRGNGNNNVIANPNIRISRGNDVITPPRNYGDRNRIPNPNDVDVIVDNRDRTFIGRLFEKLENSNVKVRTYNNPNSVPNQIRNNSRPNNNWNNNINRNNWNNNSSINNSYNSTRSSNSVRSYSPPPSSGMRSSAPPVINRGSSVGNGGSSRGSSGRINN